MAENLPSGVVTLVFSDIEGSTRLLRDLGDGYGDVLRTHHSLLRKVWRSHGGVEVDTEGDAFFVSFARANDAVEAVTEAQEVLGAYAWPAGHSLKVRIGVHTGEPELDDSGYWGIDVHYAARLCAAAHGGQVLLSASTRALVPELPADDLGEHALKDFPAARRIYHLVVAGRGSDLFPAPNTVRATASTLPSLPTPLVGRDSDLADLCDQVRRGARLVTLVGIGGTGKTSLAIAAGASLVESFPEGLFFAELGPVADSEEVADAIAASVGATVAPGVDPASAIVARAARRRILLIIDNFEHVLAAAPVVQGILAGAPGAQILVTSQAPLQLPGETVIALETLETPQRDVVDAAALADVPAVALFVERARAADVRFALTAENAFSIAELCRRLDGLPLAIELAAARTRLAGPQELLAAISRGSDALGQGPERLPHRQRGLAAALDYTIGLLPPETRDAFAALGAFAGEWSLDQAQELLGPDTDVWEHLSILADFSLVRARGDGRLTMAERVREHSRKQLAATGREHEIRRRHAELTAERLRQLFIATALEFTSAIARTRELSDDIDYAIAWSATGDPDVHRRLIAYCGRPLHFTGRLHTVAPEVERLAEEDGDERVAGYLAMTRGDVALLRTDDFAETLTWVRRATEHHRRAGSAEDLLMTLFHEACWMVTSKQPRMGRDLVGEALALAQERGADSRWFAGLDAVNAFLGAFDGREDEADAMVKRILAEPERDDAGRFFAPYIAAEVAERRGNPGEVLAWMAVTCVESTSSGDLFNAVGSMGSVSELLAEAGRDGEAVVIDSAAANMAVKLLGMNLGGRAPGVYKAGPAIHAAHVRLGESARRYAAIGSSLGPDEAFALVADIAHPAAGTRHRGLGGRRDPASPAVATDSH